MGLAMQRVGRTLTAWVMNLNKKLDRHRAVSTLATPLENPLRATFQMLYEYR